MDFRTQSASLDALAGINADALIVVIAGEALPAKLDKAVADAAKDAIKLGDFELKAGKTLLVQRAPGVKSARLVLAAAGKASLKGAKTALAAADAVYTYRHTKPSAPAASALGKITLLADKAVAKAVKLGLDRGQAIA